jgi:hypothetical protein
MSTYLFIDGGYLRDNFKKCMSRYHAEDVGLSIPLTTVALLGQYGIEAEKIFYYDCIDERGKDDETSEQYAHRVTAQE